MVKAVVKKVKSLPDPVSGEELLTLLDHLNSHIGISGVCVTQSLVYVLCYVDQCLFVLLCVQCIVCLFRFNPVVTLRLNKSPAIQVLILYQTELILMFIYIDISIEE
jgi:hypothetical protein